MPALWGWRQADIYDFKPSLDYIVIPGQPGLCRDRVSERKQQKLLLEASLGNLPEPTRDNIFFFLTLQIGGIF